MRLFIMILVLGMMASGCATGNSRRTTAAMLTAFSKGMKANKSSMTFGCTPSYGNNYTCNQQ